MAQESLDKLYQATRPSLDQLYNSAQSPDASATTSPQDQLNQGQTGLAHSQNLLNGIFADKPTGDSPYQTGSWATSPILPYEAGQSPLGTAAKAVVNAPTSIIRLASSLLDPKTYIGLERAAAGGIESIPGISQFYDSMSKGKGADILQGNRDAFHNFVDTLENQYGSYENIKRSIAEDPAGTALVVRGALEGAAGVLDKTAGITEKAGLPKVSAVAKTVEGTAKTVGQTVFPIEKIAGAVNKVSDAFRQGSELRKNIQIKLGKANVSPQTGTSATRLSANESPIAKYDEYATQAQKGATDIKADSPLTKVGSEIGNAFNDVTGQRQGIGKLLEQELGKVKNEKVSIDNSNFFDKTKAQYRSMTAGDKSLIDTYVSELNKLGSKPSIGKVDSFLRRVPQEIVEYKGTKGITDTTPAEGFIKTDLRNIRGSIDATKNPKLENYVALRKTYSDLSDFLDEGVSHLGKKTQSGDYAKDASAAKSSVQSLLNGGKKDWMMKLEALTDYPALDHSVLALQAMKDAGDFRGVSLLEKMTEGAPPLTQRAWASKILSHAAQRVVEKIAGTPAEQTRAFLKSLSDSGAKSETIPSEGLINKSSSDTNTQVDSLSRAKKKLKK